MNCNINHEIQRNMSQSSDLLKPILLSSLSGMVRYGHETCVETGCPKKVNGNLTQRRFGRRWYHYGLPTSCIKAHMTLLFEIKVYVLLCTYSPFIQQIDLVLYCFVLSSFCRVLFCFCPAFSCFLYNIHMYSCLHASGHLNTVGIVQV